MEKKEAFKIEGRGGEKALKGTISISGSKNESLGLLTSSLLFEGPVSFSNIPEISDIRALRLLLESVGAVTEQKGGNITITPPKKMGTNLDAALARKFRASVMLIGPLLSREGVVTFPPPGGCLIGKRPIDIFLSGFEKMGAKVEMSKDAASFHITAPEGGLRGARIVFRVQSVTGTQTLLMAATLAKGTTTLVNVALEPEVTDLALFLKSCGAKIEGIGTPTLIVEGRDGKLLVQNGNSHHAISDRIEAGSYVVLGALCAETLTITDCTPEHLELPLEMLREAGVSFLVHTTSIEIHGNTRPNKEYKPLTLRTHEYPGFPTDLQAPFGIFATQATGESVIEEMIFEGRLSYLHDLAQMGAVVDIAHPHKSIVRGPSKLLGRELYTPDLRAGLAYIIAAIVGKGTSYIHDIHYIDRGYERVEEKLRGVGVAIERITL
ncbi:MAG: UDP-N-acetylglucosamine 1-carboxyvinyltransferase [Patescibacteria group bacterium]